MGKKKRRVNWIWWLVFIIFVLIALNLFFYFHYYSRLLPTEDTQKKPAEIPRVTKPCIPPKPQLAVRVSIVIDDIGYALGPLKKLLKLKEAVTYAVIPHLPHSKESARMIRESGGELILHLPMEPNQYKERFNGIQPGMLTTKMTETELLSQLNKNFIPGIVGINNHMGSKFTQDRRQMRLALGWMKQRGLFFLDSVTSPKSVGWQVAGDLGIKRVRRNIFLDNENSYSAIETQWKRMIKVAHQKGQAVAIGHLRSGTVKALSRLLPKLSTHGIQLVPLSALVN